MYMKLKWKKKRSNLGFFFQNGTHAINITVKQLLLLSFVSWLWVLTTVLLTFWQQTRVFLFD